jgi:hypothetical protein
MLRFKITGNASKSGGTSLNQAFQTPSIEIRDLKLEGMLRTSLRSSFEVALLLQTCIPVMTVT